jgi:hypothetical protein
LPKRIAVRTALYFTTRGEGHRVVQVTTLRPATAIDVGGDLSVHRTIRQEILIDADFRRPRVHKLFAFGRDTGLSWSSTARLS